MKPTPDEKALVAIQAAVERALDAGVSSAAIDRAVASGFRRHVGTLALAYKAQQLQKQLEEQR